MISSPHGPQAGRAVSRLDTCLSWLPKLLERSARVRACAPLAQRESSTPRNPRESNALPGHARTRAAQECRGAMIWCCGSTCDGAPELSARTCTASIPMDWRRKPGFGARWRR